MKKLLTLALCSIMVLGLGSCGKKNSSSTPISSNPDTTQTSTPDSSSEESSDTGTSDTGSTDSGSSDSGSTDSGSSDSGSTDSGSSDSGSSDSGSTDSGSSDSSSSDSGNGDTTPETFTIYFQNNWNWSDIRAYVFDSTISEGVNYEVEWPGTALTATYKDGAGTSLHDMYALELPVDTTYDSVIFNGWDAGKWNETTQENGVTNQTPDIKFADLNTAGHNTVYVTWDATLNNGAGANSYGSYLFTPVDPCTDYIIEVANVDVTTTATVTEKGNNYAKFTTTVEAGTNVVIKGDGEVLLTYTAEFSGEHTFVVNHKNVASVLSAPADPNALASLYFIPNNNWKSDNARFAIYYWDANGNHWADLTDENGDGTYECYADLTGYSNVIICRMKPTPTENNWDNKWSQTGDLSYNSATPVFTMNADSWDSGLWSALA